jgi:hypothetical protein
MAAIDSVRDKGDSAIKNVPDSSEAFLNDAQPLSSQESLKTINDMKGTAGQLPEGFAQSSDFQFVDSEQVNVSSPGSSDVTINIGDGQSSTGSNERYDNASGGDYRGNDSCGETQEEQEWSEGYRDGYRDANVDGNYNYQRGYEPYVSQYPYDMGCGSEPYEGGYECNQMDQSQNPYGGGFGGNIYGDGMNASFGMSRDGQMNASVSGNPLESLMKEFGPLAQDLLPMVEALAPIAAEAAPALLAL